MMVRGLLAIILLMALTGIVMCVLFNRLIVARLERLIRVAKRVVGGEFNVEVVPSAQDEVGKFEELFEQFRRVFVNLVGNIENEPATQDVAPVAAPDPVCGAQPELAGSSTLGGK